MRYVVKVNGKEYDVEVEKLGGPYASLSRSTAYVQGVPVAVAPVAFIQKSDDMYRYRLILKMPREVREKYSHLIRWQIDVFKNRKNKASKKERILVDAEPYDLG